MRNQPLTKPFANLLLAMLLAGNMAHVMAADLPPNLEPIPDIPPPPMGADTGEADEPEVTIVKKNGETIEEYRINGELYMMKVTPAGGGPSYYLSREDQEGGWINTGPNKPLIIPKWILFRF